MALTNISDLTKDPKNGAANQTKPESNFGKEHLDTFLREVKLILWVSIKAFDSIIIKPLGCLLVVVQITLPIATPGFKAKTTAVGGAGGAPPVCEVPVLAPPMFEVPPPAFEPPVCVLAGAPPVVVGFPGGAGGEGFPPGGAGAGAPAFGSFGSGEGGVVSRRISSSTSTLIPWSPGHPRVLLLLALAFLTSSRHVDALFLIELTQCVVANSIIAYFS